MTVMFLVKCSLVKKEVCTVMMQQLVPLWLSTHFHAVTVKHRSSMWNWQFCLPGQILCEQSHWCQRKSMLFTLFFTYLAYFGLREFSIFHSNTHVWLMLSSPNACLIIARVSVTLTKCDAHTLSDPSWNRNRPDIQLQTERHKKISTSN
jgi:hypothetical protein